MKKAVRAYAPASVANASSGFDVLGFALEEPGDIVIAKPSDVPGIKIFPLTGAFSSLPNDPKFNTAGVAVQALMDAKNISLGMELEIRKGVPIVGGMGSSASSAVAAVIAVNELFDLQLVPRELLPFVLESERVATGVPHADNAAPSLLGGFTLIHSLDPLDVVSLATPAAFTCALVHPHMHIKTRDAREILPKSVPMGTATRQMGHIAGFVAGLYQEDFDLISRSFVDELAEPYRGQLIPGYERVKAAALEQGALGCGISGSGPSMFALCPDADIAHRAGYAMEQVFLEEGLESDLFISAISQQGARILE
ncbi:MAG: homoserine kinase [Candidatus Marinimicrobia bacterium]|nr:homoserine kinase [FCB group bacterium]MBL7023891.1 homoserine kinase [Candidatus Neomarinimicrobiota bacterium]